MRNGTTATQIASPCKKFGKDVVLLQKEEHDMMGVVGRNAINYENSHLDAIWMERVCLP